MLVILWKKQIITLKLLRLKLRYQVLMVKFIKINLLEINYLFGLELEPSIQEMVFIFQPIHRYVKIIAIYITEWKSNGLSDESIKPLPTSDSSLTPLIDYYSYNLKFNGSILRQSKVSYTHEKTVNIYIVYELAGSSYHSNDRALKKSLFGAVTLTKNYKLHCNVWLCWHYNRANSYLFLNGKETVKFKAKDSAMLASPLCLGNISKDCSVNNMKKTGLNGYIF